MQISFFLNDIYYNLRLVQLINSSFGTRKTDTVTFDLLYFYNHTDSTLLQWFVAYFSLNSHAL